MGTLANSEDPDEMLPNASFHHGLHCLRRQSQSLKKENNLFLFEMITCVSSVYTMDHPDFIICCFMENSFFLKRGNIHVRYSSIIGNVIFIEVLFSLCHVKNLRVYYSAF